MVNLLWKFHRLPCTSSNRRPAACEVVGGIQYTYSQPAQRARQRGKALYLQRNLGNACAGFKGFEER
jgi:hypothetical protein